MTVKADNTPDEKLKILMAASVDLAIPNASSIHFTSIAKAFAGCGHHVSIITPRSVGNTQDIERTLETAGVEIKFAPTARHLGLPNTFSVLSQIPWIAGKINRHQVDMVYIRSGILSFILVGLIRILCRTQIIVEHNGWIPEEGKMLGHGWWLRVFENIAQTLDARLAHHVRVVTPGLQRKFLTHGVSYQRLFTVGNGTNIQAIHPVDRNISLRELGLDPEKLYIGFVGNLAPWQGVTQVMEGLPALLEKVPNAHLIICGDGYEMPKLLALMSLLDISSSVTFLGWRAVEDMRLVINCFDVAVAPFTNARNSEIGLSPLKIRDYAAAGRPTVAAHIEGIWELEAYGWLLTYKADSIPDLVEKIAEILPDTERRAAMSQKARRYALAHFSWEKIAKEILSEIQKSTPKLAPDMHVITDLDVGGAERMLVNTLINRRRDTPQPVVVSLIPAGHFREQLLNSGIIVISLNLVKIGNVLNSLFSLARIIKALQPNFIQGWMYHANIVALLGMVIGGQIFHSSLIWGIRCSAMDMRHYGLLLRIVIWVSALLSWLPKVIIYNSNIGLRDHMALGFSSSDTKVILNGIDTKIFKPQPAIRERIRNEMGIPQDKPVVLMAARVDPMKDYQTLLAAIDLLPGVITIVVGKNTIENLPDRPNLFRIGMKVDMPEIYSIADIVVLSSAFGEGFPNVIAEGMAVGLIPVVTDVGDAAHMVGDVGRVVPPRNPEALAAAIKGILSLSKSQRAKMGRRARARIKREFSIVRAIDNFESIYTIYRP